MRTSRPLHLLLLTATVCGVFGFLLGSQQQTQATLLLSGTEEQPASIDLAPVWKAWRLLEDRYVPATSTEPLMEQDRVWGMIEGLAAAYDDPYTIFLPPRDSKQFTQDLAGSFGGVGIEIGMRNSFLTVIAPLKGTPGEEAGLMPQDIIAKINGEDTVGMYVDEAVERIRGEVGTQVVLTIAREGEPDFLEIPVTRSIIEIPTLETEVYEEEIFSIALYNFGGTAETEMRAALREYVAGGYNKLILDLRGNPGGYLETSVEIASYFLPITAPVVIEDFGDDTRVHRSKGYQNIIGDEDDIVVLVDGGSASASEILAGALQDHEKAVLIGAQTFGKGSVQELLDVTPETSLKVTIARWLTPNGTSISKSGLTPTYEVALTGDDIEAEQDPQLDAAIAYLMNGTIPEPPATTTADALLPDNLSGGEKTPLTPSASSADTVDESLPER